MTRAAPASHPVGAEPARLDPGSARWPVSSDRKRVRRDLALQAVLDRAADDESRVQQPGMGRLG